MPKQSPFLRRPAKRPKSKPSRPKPQKPPKSTGEVLAEAVTQVSSIIQNLKRFQSSTFAGAPPMLRAYVDRSTHELQDLLKLIVHKMDGTKHLDQLEQELVRSVPQEAQAGFIEALESFHGK